MNTTVHSIQMRCVARYSSEHSEMESDIKTTILITGSTGNIGSEILKQLSNSTSDLNLRAAVHSGDASINNSKDKRRVQQVVMDFDRPQTIVEGLKNVDELFVLTPTHHKMVEFTSNLVNGVYIRQCFRQCYVMCSFSSEILSVYIYKDKVRCFSVDPLIIGI